MTDQMMPNEDASSQTSSGTIRPVSATRYALTAAARAGIVGALAIGLTGFVLASQLTSADGVERTETPLAADSSWDMRSSMATLSSRDFVEGRQALEPGQIAAFSVVVDGATVPVESNARTLAEALEQAGITLDADDIVSAPLSSELVPGQEILIQRVTGDQVVEEVVDTHGTSQVTNDSLYKDQKRVTVEGVDGLTVTTYTTSMVDGAESSREVLATVVVRERVDEVVEVGTKDRPVVAAAPRASGSSSSSSSAASSPSSSSGSVPAAPPTYTGDAVALGQSMAANRGWTGDQWSCLYSLWQKESNWNPNARNRSSGATGIPQALPGSKMASHGSDWATNPATQIAWGLDYIAGRYGTPCGAWNHSVAKNWY
nr:DUF348 domain-containing protein [Actinomycetales bacterium]